MKRYIGIIVPAALTLVLGTGPVFAETVSQNTNQPSKAKYSDGNVTQQRNVTQQKSATKDQMNTLDNSQIVEDGRMNSTFSTNFVVPNTVSPNFSYTQLSPYYYVDTTNSYYVSTPETVWVNAVQYTEDSSTPKIAYQLINLYGGPNSAPVVISGTYTSQDCFVYFKNVQPGTYVLRITNEGTGAADGNGYVHY